MQFWLFKSNCLMVLINDYDQFKLLFQTWLSSSIFRHICWFISKLFDCKKYVVHKLQNCIFFYTYSLTSWNETDLCSTWLNEVVWPAEKRADRITRGEQISAVLEFHTKTDLLTVPSHTHRKLHQPGQTHSATIFEQNDFIRFWKKNTVWRFL